MSWALPLELGPGGCFPLERGDPVVEGARLVLGVAPGERRLLPEFGWRAHGFRDLEGRVEREAASVLAEEALRLWVPDLGVERVEVTAVEGRRVALELHARGRRYQLDVELRPWDAS